MIGKNIAKFDHAVGGKLNGVVVSTAGATGIGVAVSALTGNGLIEGAGLGAATGLVANAAGRLLASKTEYRAHRARLSFKTVEAGLEALAEMEAKEAKKAAIKAAEAEAKAKADEAKKAAEKKSA